MIRKLVGAVFAAALALSIGTPAAEANYYYRDGNGTLQSIFAFTCQSTVICPAQVFIDSSGAEKATTTNPLTVGGSNGGTSVPLSVGSNGFLNVNASVSAIAETTASSGVLKASSGNLFTVSVDAVTATVDLKLLLFNSATLPADGAVAPYKCVSFKGDGTQASFLLSWAPNALAFSTGISAAVSSSTACTIKTNVTATISGQVQ